MNFTSQKSCDIIVLEEGYAAWPRREMEGRGTGLNCRNPTAAKRSDITAASDQSEQGVVLVKLYLFSTSQTRGDHATFLCATL